MTFASSSRAQSSLEYLLLLAAFFSAFGLILPVIVDASNNLLFASNDLLAKQIANDAQEQVSLLLFLGDGSQKTLEYSTTSKLILSSMGEKISIESNNKKFDFNCYSQQSLARTEVSGNFDVVLKKDLGKISVFVQKS